MSLFDFILSLLLVFNPGISEADFNNVYSLLDDTSIHSIVVDDSAFDKLSQLSDSGVAPLDLTSDQAGWLRYIMQALYQSGNPNYTSLYSQVTNILNKMNDAGVISAINSLNSDLTGSSSFLAYLPNMNKNLNEIFKMLDITYYHLVSDINDKLGSLSASGGWDVPISLTFFDPYSWSAATSVLSPMQLVGNIRDYFIQTFWIPPGFSVMDFKGDLYPLSGGLPFSTLFNDFVLGQRNYLVGVDRKTAFSFIPEDITQEPTIVEVDNMLDALGYIGTQIQNPLQRLAYVFANPQDLEIRKDVSENVDQAQQDFFKPDGQGSVKPAQIGDAAGISGGAAGALASPGSVGDLTSQINNGDNFSFFSQTTLGNLDTVPVTYSADDDFIDFYDPLNPVLWEALDEPVP